MARSGRRVGGVGRGASGGLIAVSLGVRGGARADRIGVRVGARGHRRAGTAREHKNYG